jgi:hypothetical protein
VKAIAIHIINGKWLDLVSEAFGEPFQLSIHFRILAGLQSEAG